MDKSRWRTAPVIDVRATESEPILFPAPTPRFCNEPGCRQKLSILNSEDRCFRHQAGKTTYAIHRGQRPAVDRNPRTSHV